VAGDEDHAFVDDDGLDRSALELLAGGAAVEVAVLDPLGLGGFEIADCCGVVAELTLVGVFLGVGDVGFESEEGVAVEVVQILVGELELVGVAGVEIDLHGVGGAGVGVFGGGVLTLRVGILCWLGGGRWVGGLCERGAAQQQCGQNAMAGGHTVGPIQL